MSIPEAVLRSSWYGAVDPSSLDVLREAVSNAGTPDEFALAALELFKRGDFSPKARLIELLGSAREQPFANFAMRVFQSVCTNEDLRDPSTLGFLAETDPAVVWLFATGGGDMLSIEAAPIMLALLEIWDEDPEMGAALRDGLDRMFRYRQALGEVPELDELGEFVSRESSARDHTQYWDGVNLVFPGDLTKRLVDQAALTARTGDLFGLDDVPRRLSAWSGLECPVFRETPMDSDRLGEVLSYVKALQGLTWVRGVKCFYGHPVDQ